ncbi:DUF3203 family protein [Pseudomonas sp. Z3-6]|uniref:DUF3203 family protein n=1 Tax=Pseudomonas sp. Z3-6 TaxID=2817411 RepID=UPI003DA84EB3
MPIRIEKQTCYFDSIAGSPQRPASELTIKTDPKKAMSFVELDDNQVYITEPEADALTVAGAVDERRHLKATDSGSAI